MKKRKAKGKLNKALLFTIDSLIVSLEDKESEDDNDMQEEEDAWPEAVEGPHPSQVSIRRCGPCVDKLKTKQHKIEKDTLSKKKNSVSSVVERCARNMQCSFVSAALAWCSS